MNSAESSLIATSYHYAQW